MLNVFFINSKSLITFVDLKTVFFLNSLFYFISLTINIYNIRFLNENVVTNDYFFILRLPI